MRWWDGAAWTEDTYERTEPLELSRALQPTRPSSARTSGRSAPTMTADGVPVAGWWPRAAARLLDMLVTGALTAAVGWSQTRVFVQQVADQMDAAVRAAENSQQAPAFQYDLATLKALTVLSLVWLAVSLVYDLAFLLWRGATPGKLALGLRVRRRSPAERLTFGAVARRWLAFEAASAVSYVGTLYLVLDVLWPLRDPRRQALHDKYAGTVVVRKR